MPTYEYKCKSCAHTFDIIQSMTDDSLTVCPECDGEIFRVIGKNIGISFSGPGFYVTDSKKSSGGVSGKKDTVKKKDNGSSSSKK
ncbi:zinc ribbon domain-containing protein [bacterium]|jgi:putative FmdB family regulatory protein|nr:zinc ribbon domain-containing protein [bacterium]